MSVYRTIGPQVSTFLAHLSQRLMVSLQYTSRAASVSLSVRPLTFSTINISATSRRIATKFYLKHLWGGGKAALGFWPDRIGTLVSMATDSSHRVIMGENLVSALAPSFLIRYSSYLQVTRTSIIARMSSNFGQIRPRTAALAAP